MRIVYAKSTTSVTTGIGLIHRLTRGDAWDADDPVVEAHPDMFSETPTFVNTSARGWVEFVEQATAAPGEKRRRR
jgi:hypothetical protein